jgi:F-type H+-transporting ATPase subunit epsilon
MATLHLEIVTSDKTIFEGEVDQVTVPGGGGVMGVLANHAPVLSTLKPGELRIKRGNDIEEYAIGGGFIDIHDNKVIILADSAERADEIDASRAEAAREKAEAMLKNPPSSKEDLFKLESQLRRSQVRLNIARKSNSRGRSSDQ